MGRTTIPFLEDGDLGRLNSSSRATRLLAKSSRSERTLRSLKSVNGLEWELKWVRVDNASAARTTMVRDFAYSSDLGVSAEHCAEQYCPTPVHGYNTLWPDKAEHQGGYSTHIRAQEKFVFPIPEGLASTDAASMLCGGLTTFSPLVRNGAGPGKKVGVVGLGGL